MLFIEEKNALALEDSKAFDFMFPSADDYLMRYACDVGDVLYLQKGDFREKQETLDTNNFVKLYLDSDGAVKMEDVKGKASLSLDIQKKLCYSRKHISAIKKYMDSDWHAYYQFQEFDRMAKYERFLAYFDFWKRPWWYRYDVNLLPRWLTCDLMTDIFDQKAFMWGFVARYRRRCDSFVRDGLFDYNNFRNSEPVFAPEMIFIYDLNTDNAVYCSDGGKDNFKMIRSFLKMKADEPILYQMAQFHDNSNQNAYFIGTFKEDTFFGRSFTTLLGFNMEFHETLIKASFGENGKIYGFRVHVDSPPIVDHSSNYVIVLSFEKPEILVICLETFAHVIVDLKNWTTMGFINRWDTIKRRICMSFLSNYSRLMFFPRYTTDDYAGKTPTDEKTVLFSTVVNWKNMKDTVIMPFLEGKRKQSLNQKLN